MISDRINNMKGGNTMNTTNTISEREVTPRLTCLVTGSSRLTNRAYLERKALGAGSVETYLSHYISRGALKLLRAGKSLEETRKTLGATDYNKPVAAEVLTRAIALNGKHRAE
jgi:hypothetical protein